MNYAATARSVKRQIKAAGMAMTLARITPGVYDPATGSVASTSATHTGFGVKLNYAQNMVDGSRILQGDQRVYLDPLIGATPQPADTLTIGTDVWNVVESRPLSPAGVVVLHDVQVRKA